MKQTIWVLAAALTMPAVTAMGQQNSMSSGDGSNHASQPTQEQNHAMQSGSPNDNGGGLMGDYGKNESGKKAKKKHHHKKPKKHSAPTDERQVGGGTGGGTSPQ